MDNVTEYCLFSGIVNLSFMHNNIHFARIRILHLCEVFGNINLRYIVKLLFVFLHLFLDTNTRESCYSTRNIEMKSSSALIVNLRLRANIESNGI